MRGESKSAQFEGGGSQKGVGKILLGRRKETEWRVGGGQRVPGKFPCTKPGWCSLTKESLGGGDKQLSEGRTHSTSAHLKGQLQSLKKKNGKKQGSYA